MVPAQSKARILQRAADARYKDNRRNKQNRASYQTTLTDHWPTLIPPNLPLRPTARLIMPPQLNNLHSYGCKPEANFKMAGKVHHINTYRLVPRPTPTHLHLPL